MSLKLNGATSGSIELDVPDAIGSDLNITIPATAGEVVVADASGDIETTRTGTGGSSASALVVGYQQGTWTPEVAGTTTAGTYTYGVQRGLWTRIGNLVYVQATLNNITTVATGSGSLLLIGFPYTPDANNVATGSCRLDQVDLPADTVYIVASIDTAAQCGFQAVKDDVADVSVPLSVTAFASTSADMFVTISYITDDTTWTPNAGASVS